MSDYLDDGPGEPNPFAYDGSAEREDQAPLSTDRAAWVEALFERFYEEWFSGDVGAKRDNIPMTALLAKLAQIAADEAEELVVLDRNDDYEYDRLGGSRRPYDDPIPWREALDAEP